MRDVFCRILSLYLGVVLGLSPRLLLAAKASSPPTTSKKEVAQGLELSCVGPANAKAFGIFFHGINTVQPSPYWQEILKEAETLAQRQQLRLALPRSSLRCSSPEKQGMVCWNWNANYEVIAKAWSEILSSARTCFKPGSEVKNRGESQEDALLLVGHSNGGYFLNRLVELCLLPRKTLVISIGSAGRVLGGAGSPSLDGCGSLALLVGENDPTRPKTQSYYERLRQHKAQVTMATYKGGHEIPFSLLEEMVKGLAKKP